MRRARELLVPALATCGVIAGPSGCDAAPQTRLSAPVPDKQALFGDAALVPSRAGERAREELALAAELTRSAELYPAVAQVRVDVELPEQGAARALVVARLDPTAGEVPDLAPLARALLGEDAQVHVELVRGAEAPAAPAPPDWRLALALVGFGASAGITLDRAARRRAGRARRQALG